jgi:hypothetical protein
MTDKNMNEPVARFRAGAVSVSIWANQRKVDGKEVTINSASVARNYKDKNDEWQATNNGYSALGLAQLISAATKAFEYLTSGTDSNDSPAAEAATEAPVMGASASS